MIFVRDGKRCVADAGRPTEIGRIRNVRFATTKVKSRPLLTTLRDSLVKIGVKTVCDWRSMMFRMANVIVSRALFAEILVQIARLDPAA